jgi:hypothetical protein
MVARLYLSEYCGADRTAHVFKDEEGKFVSVCFKHIMFDHEQFFSKEYEADDYAEDWVQQT